MRKIRPLQRASAFREPKRKFILYAEGANTEPDYFRAVQKTFRGALVEIEIIPAAGVPLTIARKAAEHRQLIARKKRRTDKDASFSDEDEVWAIFDRDNHPKVSEALLLCQENNVGIAFSNPCFEVWLILHLVDYQRPDDRHEVQRKLASLVKDYNPNCRKTTNCSSLMDRLEIAEERAERQLKRREEEGDNGGAPSTTVFNLTRTIRRAADLHLKKSK